MLKYKIKTNGIVPIKEIVYDELYIEPQGKYISGITSYDYNLVDGENVTVETSCFYSHGGILAEKAPEYTLTNQLPIRTENVLRQGWFEIDNNKFYIENGKVDISGLTYSLEDQLIHASGSTTIPKIEFRGNTYSAKTNNDGDYSNEDWQDVTKFTINKAQDIEIPTDKISCGDYVPYIRYKGNTYDILTSGDTRYIVVDSEIKYEKCLEKLKKYIVSGNDSDKIYDLVESGDTNTLFDDREIYFTMEDDTKLQVYYEWRETKEFSPYLFLYMDLELANSIEDSQRHFIIENNHSPIQKLIVNYDSEENAFVEFNAKKYQFDDVSVKFIVINGKEYEVFNYNELSDSSSGQIIINEIFVDVLFFKDLNDRVYATKVNNAYEKNEFEVKEYNTITIDDVRYLVKTDYIEYDEYSSGSTQRTIIQENYIEYNGIDYYSLDLVVKNGNICICKFHNMDLYETDKSKLQVYSNTIHNIVKNQDSYRIKLYVDTFSIEELSTLPYTTIIKILKNDRYLSIPLIMSAEVANNLQQEMLVNSQFVEYEKNRRINRIMDMEHDVYYPIKVNLDGTYTQVDKLIFDLHFRTRNLDDWSVIEDNFQHLDSATTQAYKSEAVSGDADTNKDILYCNWNIFDHYQTDDQNEQKNNSWSDAYKYYQPSDLLYFLNFTDDDVYYQKSKIAKSFLRLMFYDSKDPLTQSLLSTSTIFMDEAKLFGKYCNTKDKRYLRPFNSSEQLTISSTMSVRYEPCTELKTKATFDESLRLDSQIVVENKYETSTTSEGFYLYLFKEYVDIVNGLHPRTIYLRIQFNHAGTGKVVDMAFPFKFKDSGSCETDIEAIDFSNKDSRKEFKKGYTLGQDMYDHLFLPIQVVYDNIEKRYVYYLPNGMVKNNDNSMRFNLYELKVNNGTQTQNSHA